MIDMIRYRVSIYFIITYLYSIYLYSHIQRKSNRQQKNRCQIFRFWECTQAMDTAKVVIENDILNFLVLIFSTDTVGSSDDICHFHKK